MDTEIRVSTESRPWRRKFSRRSSRDSNPRPFNHESGAVTTELSPPPKMLALLLFLYVLDGGCSSCSHSNTCIDGKHSSCAADPFAINCEVHLAKMGDASF